jgi:hypothetical protein
LPRKSTINNIQYVCKSSGNYQITQALSGN